MKKWYFPMKNNVWSYWPYYAFCAIDSFHGNFNADPFSYPCIFQHETTLDARQNTQHFLVVQRKNEWIWQILYFLTKKICPGCQCLCLSTVLSTIVYFFTWLTKKYKHYLQYFLILFIFCTTFEAIKWEITTKVPPLFYVLR